MALADPANIRNVAVVGHRGAGKTSLVEALLFTTGAKNRLGSVVDGTTSMDHDEDEIKRQMTISMGLGHVFWRGHKVNLIDTPGEASFINEAFAALPVVEIALVVVNGVSKVEVQTERLWKRATDLRLARVLAVNMMDRERAYFEEVVEAIKSRLGDEAVPVAIPIGQEQGFKGVVDVITRKAYEYSGTSGKGTEGVIPEEFREAAEQAREALIEKVVEADDSLLEKYLEGNEISEEEFARAFRAAVLQGLIAPIIPVCSTKNIGSDRLLELILLGPSPAEFPPRVAYAGADGAEEIKVTPDHSAPTAVFVFKTIYDQFSGRVNLIRIFSGKIATDTQLLNIRTNDKERTGNILLMVGKETKPIEEAGAGDIVAVAKLKDTGTGDTLCDPSRPLRFPRYEFPPPAISFAITPKSRGDEEKVSNGLKRLSEEDPAIEVRFDQQTKEMLISGTSQVHVEVILEKLKRRFGVEVELHPPQVPYRETIRKKASAQGRHKKQTGGRGQFGDCWIEIEPLPRGAGYQFEDAIFGGAIPRNFIPAVEKGILEAMEHGILAGYPVVDVKVRLYDGSYHPVDSSELAFKLAGSLAWNNAMAKADPVLLEPVMNVEIIVPEENMGDIMGDLSSRRGRPQGSERMGEMQVIRAQVPLAEMLNYAPQLRSITGGRGSFTMEFDHYEEVPPHLAEKIIQEAKARKAAES
ncbi:MAG: elongation factor G [Thermoleophilia bacterium]|nr:elongation factor G [Thermoleophilia bacterium]